MVGSSVEWIHEYQFCMAMAIQHPGMTSASCQCSRASRMTESSLPVRLLSSLLVR